MYYGIVQVVNGKITVSGQTLPAIGNIVTQYNLPQGRVVARLNRLPEEQLAGEDKIQDLSKAGQHALGG